MRHLFDRLARLIRNRAGNVAIIAALALPVMVGFFGLGSETAYWYFRDRDLQGAAFDFVGHHASWNAASRRSRAILTEGHSPARMEKNTESRK